MCPIGLSQIVVACAVMLMRQYFFAVRQIAF
jgi:hypothetical protein